MLVVMPRGTTPTYTYKYLQRLFKRAYPMIYSLDELLDEDCDSKYFPVGLGITHQPPLAGSSVSLMGRGSSISVDTRHGYNGQYLEEFSVLWRIDDDKSPTYSLDSVDPSFSNFVSEIIDTHAFILPDSDVSISASTSTLSTPAMDPDEIASPVTMRVVHCREVEGGSTGSAEGGLPVQSEPWSDISLGVYDLEAGNDGQVESAIPSGHLLSTHSLSNSGSTISSPLLKDIADTLSSGSSKSARRSPRSKRKLACSSIATVSIPVTTPVEQPQGINRRSSRIPHRRQNFQKHVKISDPLNSKESLEIRKINGRYMCPFLACGCGVDFSRKHDVIRHIESGSNRRKYLGGVSSEWPVKKFRCNKCGVQLSRLDALRRHTRGDSCKKQKRE